MLLQRGGCRVDFWYSFILLTPACGWATLEVIKPRSLQAMSEEQLKAFQEAVKADAGLQEKLKAAKDADAVVEIAKAAGFVISADALQELSDEQLEGVAGGRGSTTLG